MCHQTVCLVARHLEAHGIPTVVLGSAHDILRAGCPPRAVFVDYPLGHSAGKPDAADDQLAVVSGALDAFTTLREPGRLLELPQRWGDDAWRAAAVRPWPRIRARPATSRRNGSIPPTARPRRRPGRCERRARASVIRGGTSPVWVLIAAWTLVTLTSFFAPETPRPIPRASST